MGTRRRRLAPPLIVVLMAAIGWRAAFVVFGAIGMIWCVFWQRWFKDDPATHPSVNAAELETIRRGLPPPGALPPFGWRHLLSGNVVLLCLMYFTMPYTLYFNLTWLPTYLKEVRGFTVQEAGYIAGLVLFAGAMANWAGGKLTDALVRRYGLRVGRSIGAVTLPLSEWSSSPALARTGSTPRRCSPELADDSASGMLAMCPTPGPRAGRCRAMNTVGNSAARSARWSWATLQCGTFVTRPFVRHGGRVRDGGSSRCSSIRASRGGFSVIVSREKGESASPSASPLSRHLETEPRCT